MLESDGIDDVTILVNSSPAKMMGGNLSYANGFQSMSNAVLCAKASMLLQVRITYEYWQQGIYWNLKLISSLLLLKVMALTKTH